MKTSHNHFSIAVVEDDAILREELAHFLRGNGHTVTELVTGMALNELLTEQTIDVIILDLNLPGMNGFEIAESLKRNHPAIGILMLTARTSLPDRVKSYDSGADLYLPKPTAPMEILAAVNSLGRRLLKPASVNDWELIESHHALVNQSISQKILLSPFEETLILCLHRAPDYTLDAEVLCDTLSRKHLGHVMTRRALENIISRLRKKLAEHLDEDTRQIIRAVRGVGYQLCLRFTIKTYNRTPP